MFSTFDNSIQCVDWARYRLIKDYGIDSVTGDGVNKTKKTSK